MDIVVSVALLVLLSPVLACAAIAIRLCSPGPILFRATRIGRDFRPFVMLKLRTMVIDSAGPPLTVGGDPRITAVGSILRRTKLDELPQLVNVLRGDMSLVGPRPEVSQYVSLFRSDYETILAVRPGMTGLASIAYADEAAVLAAADDPHAAYISEVLPHKIELGKEYVQSQSLALDLQILMKTVSAIFHTRKGNT
ncbi:MAG: sugar transferase [Acidimicrobiia bacterium]|nr:sugar transferase [Acidimicrobiia bacterium]